MESFVEFIFNEPSLLLVVAIVFLMLGGLIVYFLMKPDQDYIAKLKSDNKQLYQEKHKWMEKALDWKDILDKQKRDKND